MSSLNEYLDTSSVNGVFGESEIAMIYGYEHCHYSGLAKAVRNGGSELNVKHLIRYEEAGQMPSFSNEKWTLDNREVHRIRYDHFNARVFKAAVTNVVYENYLRSQANLPLIKIVFCLDTDSALGSEDGKIPEFCLENLTSRTARVKTSEGVKNANDLVTNKELRRAYKLCTDPTLPSKFRGIAQKTFAFTKVNLKVAANNLYIKLQPISCPWQTQEWDNLWKDRIITQKAQKKKTERDPHPWREQLQTLIGTQSKPSCIVM